MFYSGWNDEINQVNGNVYLMDIAGYTIKHSTFMSMDDMKKSTKMWQVSMCRDVLIVYRCADSVANRKGKCLFTSLFDLLTK